PRAWFRWPSRCYSGGKGQRCATRQRGILAHEAKRSDLRGSPTAPERANMRVPDPRSRRIPKIVGTNNGTFTGFSHMRVLTTAPDEVRELSAHWTEGSSLVVVALCAAWCDTCNEFRASFERIAEARPDVVFVWLDIEDDSDVCG